MLVQIVEEEEEVYSIMIKNFRRRCCFQYHIIFFLKRELLYFNSIWYLIIKNDENFHLRNIARMLNIRQSRLSALQVPSSSFCWRSRSLLKPELTISAMQSLELLKALLSTRLFAGQSANPKMSWQPKRYPAYDLLSERYCKVALSQRYPQSRKI